MTAVELGSKIYEEIFSTQKSAVALFDASTLQLINHNNSFQKSTLIKKIPLRDPSGTATLTDFFFEVESEAILELVKVAKINGSAFDQCRQMLKGKNAYFPAEIQLSLVEEGRVLRLECESVLQMLSLEKLRFQKEKLQSTLQFMNEELILIDSDMRCLDEMGTTQSHFLQSSKISGLMLGDLLGSLNAHFPSSTPEDFLFHLSSLFLMPPDSASALCRGSDLSLCVGVTPEVAKVLNVRIVPLSDGTNVVRLALILRQSLVPSWDQPTSNESWAFLSERTSLQKLAHFHIVKKIGKESSNYSESFTSSLSLIFSEFFKESDVYLKLIAESKINEAAGILNFCPDFHHPQPTSQTSLIRDLWNRLSKSQSAQKSHLVSALKIDLHCLTMDLNPSDLMTSLVTIALVHAHSLAYDLLTETLPTFSTMPWTPELTFQQKTLCVAWPKEQWDPNKFVSEVERMGFRPTQAGTLSHADLLDVAHFLIARMQNPSKVGPLSLLRWVQHWSMAESLLSEFRFNTMGEQITFHCAKRS
jgi:hypothetical protein